MSMGPVLGPPLPRLYTALRRRLKAVGLKIEPVAEPEARQLIVDVSVIVQQDVRTGIQRVVRALLGQLVLTAGRNLVVQPVFASRDHGYCHAKLFSDGRIQNIANDRNVLQPVVARRGDVFLGLDLAAHLLPHTEADLARWRHDGVSINIMVYDLLPIQRPDWFPPKTFRNFKRWLGVLARQADRCICISDDVARSLSEQLASRCSKPPPELVTIPLGSDLEASYPSQGMPADIVGLRAWLERHRVLLAVGTIEPRKGHRELLSALTLHWQAEPNSDIALLVVGRPGWKTSDLQVQLATHQERGKRLIWLNEASDELLVELYGSVAGLVSASHGEGFGLPLMEALAQRVPVLVRDLPVFREIGGPLFDYFDDDTPASLSERLQSWLPEARRPSDGAIASLPRWADSARALLEHLELQVA